MARRSKATETIAGQHLALSAAAHLARVQLVRDPLGAHDASHNVEMSNMIGTALARSARLYVLDANSGEPRELIPSEVEGAVAKKGAMVLVLNDGRTLSGVSIKRSDLQQAIAILKAIDIAEPGPAPGNPQPMDARRDDHFAKLRARVAEIEALLVFPLLPSQADRANSLAISIAREAPHGRISNLAMHLVSAVHDARGDGNPDSVRIMLARLRAAVEEMTATSS